MAAARTKSNPAACPSICVIYGNDDFLRAEALGRVMEDVLGGDRDNMGLAEFDGDTAELRDVLDECRTASLLASTRLVIVRDADDFVSANREVLEKYFKAPSPTSVLVLVCRSWPRTTRLYKAAEQLGGNIACEAPKPAAMPSWIIERGQQAYGCRIDAGAARRLADLVGPQLGLLNMELSKLATYVAPRTQISEADVEELVGESRTEVVFRIADAICAGDSRRALELWDQVISHDRDAEYRAVGGLAYAFRRLAEAKRQVEQGVPVFDVARKMGPFTDASRLGRELQRFSLRQWEDLMVRLLEIDLANKTGLGGPQLAIEKLIGSLAGNTQKNVEKARTVSK